MVDLLAAWQVCGCCGSDRVNSTLITVLLVAAVLTGVGAAAFLVMRSPAFWYDVGAQFVSNALPKLVALVTKRMSPEDEASWREAEKAGRGDEWLRKRKGGPPKG